jgi:hypothetical protein
MHGMGGGKKKTHALNNTHIISSYLINNQNLLMGATIEMPL